MIKVLITSQGGAGSLSLINDLSKTLRKKIIFYGTHFDRIILKRADKISKKILLLLKLMKKKILITKFKNNQK